VGRIDRELIDALAPDNGTVRHNHDHCPAGVDTKRRLYVTRKENGSVVAYCHNCGNSGASIHRRTHFRRDIHSNSVASVGGEIKMPLNIETDMSKWPIEARTWVLKAKGTLTNLQEYALAYDLDTKRVIIPKFNLDNELVMYQSRNVGLDDGPKYMTVKQGEADIYSPVQLTDDADTTLVICEDMMSAIKLVEIGTVDALPLFSSNVKFDKLLTHVLGYDIIIVWLDNDGVEIERHRDSLARNCRALGKNVHVVTEWSDPKKCSNRIIVDTITKIEEEYEGND
jgi:hypothetical protein